MFPRKVGSAWEFHAPAKLNLQLEVLGRRDDGFHELETLMVPVRLFDQLRWSPADALSLQIRELSPPGPQQVPTLSSGDDNLVLRAARLLAQRAGIAATGRFELWKRIPLQAGMGGGSSDAAAALLLANAAWGIDYDREQLAELSAELGSDVPFFLGRGAAICRGRGERVEPIAGLPKLHFVVAKPSEGLSTAEVFATWRAAESQSGRESSSERVVAALRSGALSRAGAGMINCLQTAAAELSPWVARLDEAFQKLGCRGHAMTGSGSAHFGLVSTAAQAQGLARRFSRTNLDRVFAISSC